MAGASMSHTPHFTLRVTPAAERLFILSISKKVAKQAVARNLLRRRIRPILRNFSDLMPGEYLLAARSGASALKGEALKAELAELFKKS